MRRSIVWHRWHGRLALAALALATALAARPALATDGEAASEAGLGVASALASLVYGPVKVVYSALGLVFGGFAYGLSGGDREVMNAVITPAIRGDYVVTPAHLRGERELEFIGRAPEYRPQTAVIEEPYADPPLSDEPLSDPGY
jgi:hypothetical protein